MSRLSLTPIASNMTEVEAGGVTVLFSYSTPVAACVRGEGWFITSQKWSSTTSRHINKWLDGVQAQERPQEYFDNLLQAGPRVP